MVIIVMYNRTAGILLHAYRARPPVIIAVSCHIPRQPCTAPPHDGQIFVRVELFCVVIYTDIC
jgi:hypothetical protein